MSVGAERSLKFTDESDPSMAVVYDDTLASGSLSGANLYAQVLAPSDGERTYEIPAYIVGETELSINEERVCLDGHALFIFNALMVCRGQLRITGRDFDRLGFLPDGGTRNQKAYALRTATSRVLQSINPAAGITVIRRRGTRAGTYYTVDPAFGVLSNKTKRQ